MFQFPYDPNLELPMRGPWWLWLLSVLNRLTGH
jgi:hypothetical protein